MNLTITGFLSGLALASALSGCGAFSDEMQIEIQMYGVPRAPSSAAGDRDPQFQSYEVQSIALTSDEGDVSLLSDAQSFKIVDRPQIILTYKTEALKGRNFTGLTVVFAPLVVGGDNEAPNLSFTLTEPTLTLVKTIPIEDGKSRTVSIKANWANTISSETMTEPTFEIVSD